MAIPKLTREQAVVVSAYTGFLISEFSDMHEAVEERMGRPVLTHEFGSKEFADKISAMFKDDFVALAPEKDSQ